MPEMPFITVILLAAWASARMSGTDKLLSQINGTPLLRRIAVACCDSQAASVLVTLPAAHQARAASLVGLPVQIAPVKDSAQGMSASILAGLAAMDRRSQAVMLVLADMPDVTTTMLDDLITAFAKASPDQILRAATETGQPGHPVLFGKRYFHALQQITGDAGARAVLKAHADKIQLVKTPGDAAVTDLDTPADWQAYRVRTADDDYS